MLDKTRAPTASSPGTVMWPGGNQSVATAMWIRNQCAALPVNPGMNST
jgi:hypothetical protein